MRSERYRRRVPTTTFRLPLPVDLRVSLSPLRTGGRYDPSLRITHDQVLRASRTPTGPATLHARVSSGEAVCEAWGPGADWALEHAPGLLGARDDLTGFSPSSVPVLARAHHRNPGLRIIRSGRVEDVLLATILGQKVTGVEATQAFQRIVRWWGESAPGPGDLRLLPPAEVLASRPWWAFHKAGVERTRAETIIEAFRRLPRMEEAATMDHDAAFARLTAVRGIGPWTAGIVQRLCFGDPDAVEVGDFHIPNMVAWNLAGEDRADDDRMLELLEPFRGHRGRVVHLLKVGGQSAPAYGARMSVGTIHRL